MNKYFMVKPPMAKLKIIKLTMNKFNMAKLINE
jgi:hypothetical protein